MSSSTQVYKPLHGLADLFALPTAINEEDRPAYMRLYTDVTSVVRPKDVFDQMLVSDITSHFWQQQRLRECVGKIAQTDRRRAVLNLLTPMVNHNHVRAAAYADAYFDTDTSTAFGDIRNFGTQACKKRTSSSCSKSMVSMRVRSMSQPWQTHST